MKDFTTYFLMNEQDVLEYITEKHSFFPTNAKLSCKEIGDGNLNYIYRLTDMNTNYSIIVKHSGIETRAKSGRLIDVDRNRIEAEILIRQDSLSPGSVPKIFTYDNVMSCCIMEDLKEYSIMRTALLEYQIFPKFSKHISSFMVDILLPSTDVVMDHKKKKQLVKNYINPDLCAISEQLVYTDSIGNFSQKNVVLDGIREFVEREIYQDTDLRLACAILKFDFMEHAQALIHGDLHSGSIFVTKEKTKVFDPEFAFYGPMGYDLGNVIAHLVFALAHEEAIIKGTKEGVDFREWILQAITEIIDLFKEKFLVKFKALVTDKMAQTEGFDVYYLNSVLSDAAGTLGIEIIRRIVGVAKVKDMTEIKDENSRVTIEEKLLLFAKHCIFNRKALSNGTDYYHAIQKYILGEK